MQRLFPSADFLQASDGEPIRSVISESADAVIVAWHVSTGQTLPAHCHPAGQDTWTVLAGAGDYILNSEGATQTIQAGDVVIAFAGQVHGVVNPYAEPLIFISVLSPATAGYQRL